ncbi:hypothetical protein G6F56_008200 [Rhizopus delemar]|nr:hypothetical protein G6F56_008200 [Rhizopus delemar]
MEMTDSSDANYLTNDEFMAITRNIYGINIKTKPIRKFKLDLLTLAAHTAGKKTRVVEGIVNLLKKLSRNRLLSLGKVDELQTTYYIFLSEIIADQDRNVANKSREEESNI